MRSRNTARERSHISFFCGEDSFCEVVRGTEEKSKGADRFAWVTSGSFSFAWATSRSLPFSPKLQNLYCLFKSHSEIWTSSSPHVFSVFGWLLELTHFRVFFGYLLILSVILSTCNKLHLSLSSETSLLILSCDRIESAKFIHCTLLPAKLVYYNISTLNGSSLKCVG